MVVRLTTAYNRDDNHRNGRLFEQTTHVLCSNSTDALSPEIIIIICLAYSNDDQIIYCTCM